GLTCSPLPMGRGSVKSSHGVLPLPAPAVCELVKGVPIYGVDVEMELVTPTGAAIVKACAREFGPLPAMTIVKVGHGAGSKQRPDGQANLLRLMIGEATAASEAQEVIVIETNLDDWSPETYPFLCERLFARGALDVALVPIQMKKGRPGFIIQVIASPVHAYGLRQTLLCETSAIGVRFRREERHTLPRRLGVIPTSFGDVKVKQIDMPVGRRITPEYEDCRRIALEVGVPIAEVYRAVISQPLDAFHLIQIESDLPEQ
ncbi:MAG: LarC family nickel insertion protein, partial [Desulfobulbaceae bacterium]|nr:LarC family nickel insertion protein [Desulfobulbaceae bacterium]